MVKFIVNNRTDTWKPDVNLFLIANESGLLEDDKAADYRATKRYVYGKKSQKRSKV